MKKFTWVQIYNEIAGKLISFKNRQLELVQIMEKMIEKGLSTISIMDLDYGNKKVKFEEIDPFTFFSNFNRSPLGGDKKIEVLKYLKEEWSLESDIPRDFDGISFVHSTDAWFFGYKKVRNSGDVSLLWALFESLWNTKKYVDENLFNEALNISSVTFTKLTKGFSWIYPEGYICINDELETYLGIDFKELGIEDQKNRRFEDYKKIVETIKGDIRFNNKSFIELTFQAKKAGKTKKNEKKLVKERTKKSKIVQEEKATGKDPLNLIFYGPPGTGKTFKLQEESRDRRENMLERIGFRKMTWFNCITLAMLDITSSENDLVRVSDLMGHNIIKLFAAGMNNENIRQTIWLNLRMHTPMGCSNVTSKDSRINPCIFWKEEGSLWRIIRNNMEDENLWKMNNLLARIKNTEFVTFHQSFSYEDFIEGIKPVIGQTVSEKIAYRIEKGVFLKLAERARNNPKENYTLFIDEINRGNISNIFGELITLIEEDKREGGENAISVQLPYSKKHFSVPSNLYIRATMNTADRGVEAIDSALRRRFEFREFLPDISKIDNHIEGLDLQKLLEKINDRLLVLVGKDKLIGHSYFLDIKTIETLRVIFRNKIIPLLEEYFYNDREKIMMVLGNCFIDKKPNKVEFMTRPEYGDEDNVVYEVRSSSEWGLKDFKLIYGD